jgi:uncharacterized BrkB/YihY/UPF0761 family membrane protein
VSEITDDELPDEQPATAGVVLQTPRFARRLGDRAQKRFDDLRERLTVVDVGMRIYERDKTAAGTLLGSALALRLFLFFVPLVLFSVGLAGVLGQYFGIDSIASTAGISGSLSQDIDASFDQGATTPWLAIGVGLLGMATTGRSLTRALVLSSALSWQLGGRQRVPIRIIGVVVGIVTGMALLTVALNRIRDAAGLAIASVSFLAVGAVYVILWSMLYLTLPRASSDPAVALPGASIVALVLTGLQAVTQFYLPSRIESSSSVYGAVGVAVAVLGWFFILGRVIAFSFAVNAVLFEQLGSLSQFIFGLPVLRVIPRKSPAFRRFFDLDRHPSE